MSAQSNKTHVDVTQLVHWQGKLTGIPRVMNELATRFAKDHATFVSWVKEAREFYEVDLEASLGSEIVYQKNSENRSERSNKLHKASKVGLVQLAKAFPAAGNLAAPAIRRQMKIFQQANIKVNERLFIPWGEWWDPNFLKKLKNLHDKGVNLVPVIHDLGPIVQPQFSAHSTASLTSYCREIVPISKLVLTVSQNTKHDLSEWLKKEGLKMPRIEVFREGDDFKAAKAKKPDDPLFVKSGLKGQDFIMDVGTLELKKNHALLYYIYKLAKSRQLELPKLILVGRSGWKTEDLQDLIKQDPDTKNEIIILQNINDEELSWLYDHCLFTIQPSFYEGWGIPIAESLARGVPCLCSNTSSMVEIAEGIVEHFSPFSTDGCLEAITRWLDPNNLKQARDKTKKYHRTSWDDTYKQVQGLMEDIG